MLPKTRVGTAAEYLRSDSGIVSANFNDGSLDLPDGSCSAFDRSILAGAEAAATIVL